MVISIKLLISYSDSFLAGFRAENKRNKKKTKSLGFDKHHEQKLAKTVVFSSMSTHNSPKLLQGFPLHDHWAVLLRENEVFIREM